MDLRHNVEQSPYRQLVFRAPRSVRDLPKRNALAEGIFDIHFQLGCHLATAFGATLIVHDEVV